MTISSVSGAARIAPVAAETTAANANKTATQAPQTDPAAAADVSTQEPKPWRFPWLSRLSAQLESASKQRSAFAAAPIMGDNIDRSV